MFWGMQYFFICKSTNTDAEGAARWSLQYGADASIEANSIADNKVAGVHVDGAGSRATLRYNTINGSPAAMVAEKGSIVRAYGTQFACFTDTKVQILTLEKRAGNSTAEHATHSPAFAAECSEQRRERQSDAHAHTHIQRESDTEATKSSRKAFSSEQSGGRSRTPPPHAAHADAHAVVQSHSGPVTLHSMQSVHSSVHSFKEAEENERQVTPRKDTGINKEKPRKPRNPRNPRK